MVSVCVCVRVRVCVCVCVCERVCRYVCACGIFTLSLLSHLSEVEIHFMNDTVMVNEGIRVISLQLQAEGIYTNGFRVSVSCLDVFPVEAKGK